MHQYTEAEIIINLTRSQLSSSVGRGRKSGTPMSDRCAYCDGPGPLTRDHVWPECFLARTGRTAAHFAHQSGKAHGADYVVADVCSRCNNEILSELDSYFCGLYDQFFAEVRGFDSSVEFQYDFDRLARALLKISFNSARACGSEHEYLRQVRSYTLTGQPRPAQLALFLEVVSPSVVTNQSPDTTRTVLPKNLYRTGVATLLTPHGHRVRPRIVAINSFYFHVVLPALPMTDAMFAEAADELGQNIKGVVRLQTGASKVTLRSSPQHALSSLAPHIQRHSATYREFFDRRSRDS